MSEDIIQLPELKDIQEMLAAAREDIQAEIQEDPDVIPSTELLIQVMNIIDKKISKEKDLSQLDVMHKIDLAAHLTFLQSLLEDFFFLDDEEDDEFDDEDETLDETEEEK